MADPDPDTLVKIIDKEIVLLRKVFDKMRGLATSVLALLGPVQSAINLLVSKLSRIKTFVPNLVSAVAKGLQKFLKTLVKTVPKALRLIAKTIGDLIKAVRSKVLATIIRAWTIAQRVLETTITMIVTTMKTLLDWVRPVEQLVGALRSVMSAIQTIFSEVVAVIAQLDFMKIIKAMIKRIHIVLQKIMNFIASLKKRMTEAARLPA